MARPFAPRAPPSKRNILILGGEFQEGRNGPLGLESFLLQGLFLPCTAPLKGLKAWHG
jgi:hypothetical protein